MHAQSAHGKCTFRQESQRVFTTVVNKKIQRVFTTVPNSFTYLLQNRFCFAFDTNS